MMQTHPLHRIAFSTLLSLLIFTNIAQAQTMNWQINELDSLGIPIKPCDIQTFYLCSEPTSEISFCPTLCLEFPYTLNTNANDLVFDEIIEANNEDEIIIVDTTGMENDTINTEPIGEDSIGMGDLPPLPEFVQPCLNFQLSDLELPSASLEVIGCDEKGCDTIYAIIYFGEDNFCEGVWPGDANNDGIAYMNDLIYLGLAYNTFSSSRIDPSTGWYPHPISDWNLSFQTGSNYKYADSNGDGKINMADTTAILDNYGTIHQKTGNLQNTSATDPLLYFDISQDSIPQGTKVSIPIMLGTPEQPIEEIYGIAFSVDYDVSVVEEGSLRIDFEDSWLGTRNLDMLGLSKNFYTKGRVDVGLTGIDRKIRANKYGQLATMSFVLKDDIAGKGQHRRNTINSIPLNLSFNYVECLTALEESVSIATQRGSVMVVSSVKPPIIDLPMRLFPNPAASFLMLDLPNEAIQNVQLFNTLGEMVLTQRGVGQEIKVDVSQLHSGIYLLNVQTAKGILVRKVSILH